MQGIIFDITGGKAMEELLERLIMAQRPPEWAPGIAIWPRI